MLCGGGGRRRTGLEQDLKILAQVEEAGKALVIAYNKWDLTDDERRRYSTARSSVT